MMEKQKNDASGGKKIQRNDSINRLKESGVVASIKERWKEIETQGHPKGGQGNKEK